MNVDPNPVSFNQLKQYVEESAMGKCGKVVFSLVAAYLGLGSCTSQSVNSKYPFANAELIVLPDDWEKSSTGNPLTDFIYGRKIQLDYQ